MAETHAPHPVLTAAHHRYRNLGRRMPQEREDAQLLRECRARLVHARYMHMHSNSAYAWGDALLRAARGPTRSSATATATATTTTTNTRRQDLGQQLLVLVPVRVRRELLARLDFTQRGAPVGSKQSK